MSFAFQQNNKMALAQDVAGSQRKARKRRRVGFALGCGEGVRGTRIGKGDNLAPDKYKRDREQAAQAGVGAVAGAAEADAEAEGERAHWRKQ